MTKIFVRALSWLVIFSLMAPLPAMADSEDSEEPAPSARFKKEELAQMLAPIALYPDSLLSQVLMASTYPLEVVEADRWVKKNADLKGDKLDEALKERNWDPSVKSLCFFPAVLSAMSDKLEETTQLGDAFLGQKDEVMDTIQELRSQAEQQGTLKTTDKQKVVVEQQKIIIEPSDPQIIYVPVYNPAVVYGPWWYPAYPPYYWYPPPYGAVFSFGVGFAVGFGVASWCSFNWWHHDINININKTVVFNDIDRHRVYSANQTWQHEVDHRRGVAYRDRTTSQRYGQSPSRSAEARREARGYPDRGAVGAGERRTAAQKTDVRTGRPSGVKGDTTTAGGMKAWAGGGRENAFGGGDGRQERMASERGKASRTQGMGGGTPFPGGGGGAAPRGGAGGRGRFR